jgi:hypothetical protein
MPEEDRTFPSDRQFRFRSQQYPALAHVDDLRSARKVHLALDIDQAEPESLMLSLVPHKGTSS